MAVVFAACSEDSPADPAPTPDMGFTPDPDAGFAEDATTPPDDGGFGPCNPVDGTGCPGTDRCVWLPPPNDTRQCRDIGEQLAIGTTCFPNATNCEAGATCIFAGVATEPTCRQVCRPDTADCDTLPSAHLCVTLQETSRVYGFCEPYTPCDPRNDTCAADEVCGVIRMGITGCIEAGSVPVGGDCSAEDRECRKGFVCLNIGPGGRCYEPCNPPLGQCATPNTRCTGIQNYDFGVCVPAGNTCDPVNDMCAANEACAIVGDGVTECRPAGSAARGQSCEAEACEKGNVCITVNPGGPTCLQPCVDGVTTCERGQCRPLGGNFSFGACL